MDTKAALIKLKPGSLERVREWARTINHRRDEVLATRRDKGVTVESWFLLSREDGDYLMSYMRGADWALACVDIEEGPECPQEQTVICKHAVQCGPEQRFVS